MLCLHLRNLSRMGLVYRENRQMGRYEKRIQDNRSELHGVSNVGI